MNASPIQRATIASFATLGLGALVTDTALAQATGFSALLTGFSLLALSPYAAFCGACFLAQRSGGQAIATFLVCALASAFAIYFYIDLIFINPGSMNGLVFYFVPICQLAAAILLLIVLLVVIFFTRLRRRSERRCLTRHCSQPRHVVMPSFFFFVFLIGL